MARTAGHGQANDEAPRTSFFQVTFDPLVVPVALRSPSRRIGHEDTSQGQAIAGSDPASGAPPPILIGDSGRSVARLQDAGTGRRQVGSASVAKVKGWASWRRRRQTGQATGASLAACSRRSCAAFQASCNPRGLSCVCEGGGGGARGGRVGGRAGCVR